MGHWFPGSECHTLNVNSPEVTVPRNGELLAGNSTPAVPFARVKKIQFKVGFWSPKLKSMVKIRIRARTEFELI